MSLFNISMLFLAHSSLLMNWLIYSWSSSNLSLDRHNIKILLCVAVKGKSSCIISDSRCHGLWCKNETWPIYLYMYQNYKYKIHIYMYKNWLTITLKWSFFPKHQVSSKIIPQKLVINLNNGRCGTEIYQRNLVNVNWLARVRHA